MFMKISIVAAWDIWKERNNLLFKGIALDLNSWTQSIKIDYLLLVHRAKANLASLFHFSVCRKLVISYL
jgi:hypothetical protein